MAFVKSREGLA